MVYTPEIGPTPADVRFTKALGDVKAGLARSGVTGHPSTAQQDIAAHDQAMDDLNERLRRLGRSQPKIISGT